MAPGIAAVPSVARPASIPADRVEGVNYVRAAVKLCHILTAETYNRYLCEKLWVSRMPGNCELACHL